MSQSHPQPDSIPHTPTPGKDPPASSPEAQDSIAPPPRSSKPRLTTKTSSSSTTQQLQHSSLAATSLSQKSKPHPSHTQPNPNQQLDPPPPTRPNFTPFFTLISDLSSSNITGESRVERGNERHPARVHYIFSDDDASELLTSSLLNSLNSPAGGSGSGELSSSKMASGSSSSSTSDQRLKGKKEKETGEVIGKEKEKERGVAREERVVIVDINADGTGVQGISSLSEKWQVLRAEISSAPTFDGEDLDDAASVGDKERGMMLRIEGVDVGCLTQDGVGDGDGVGEGKGGNLEGIGEEEMSRLLEGFDAKMNVLRRIVGERIGVGAEGGGDEGGAETGDGEGEAGKKEGFEKEMGSG